MTSTYIVIQTHFEVLKRGMKLGWKIWDGSSQLTERIIMPTLSLRGVGWRPRRALSPRIGRGIPLHFPSLLNPKGRWPLASCQAGTPQSDAHLPFLPPPAQMAGPHSPATLRLPEAQPWGCQVAPPPCQVGTPAPRLKSTVERKNHAQLSRCLHLIAFCSGKVLVCVP